MAKLLSLVLGLSSLLLLLAAFLVVAVESVDPDLKLINSNLLQVESIINEVNSNPTAGWKAGINPRFSNYTVGQLKQLLGAISTPESEIRNMTIVRHPRSLNVPTEYDARKAWPQCTTISKILDQGKCGSCWAFGAVEALSDRFCIRFGLNILLSANDLVACCATCGSDRCKGGSLISAWNYFIQQGVVTEKCDPYFDTSGCSFTSCKAPMCTKKCKDGNQRRKYYAANAYRINSNQRDIMAEVYKNGPIEVTFDVYEDFFYYKSGVYKHITGEYKGGHAVKLIGWGTTTQGEAYWLLANSWNTNWGDNGFFKMRRGTRECKLADLAVAGLPSSKNLIKEVGGSDSALDASI